MPMSRALALALAVAACRGGDGDRTGKGGRGVATEVTASDFIPSVDRYSLRVAVASRRLLAGDHPIVV